MQQLCNLAFPAGMAYKNRKIGGWSTQTRCRKLDNLQTRSIVDYRFWNIKKQTKSSTYAAKLNNRDLTINKQSAQLQILAGNQTRSQGRFNWGGQRGQLPRALR